MDKQIYPSSQDQTMSVKKTRPSNGKIIKQWIVGMTCGVVSLFSCCLCCGCCGTTKPPAVLFDDEDQKVLDDMTGPSKMGLNTLQWCGLAGLTVKCLPLCCGCCCGCCGNITPAEAVQCIGTTK